MTKQIGGQQMRDLAEMIEDKLNGLGFALIVFEFKKPGMVNYVSNAQRADMVKALKETLNRWKNNQDFTTPETN